MKLGWLLTGLILLSPTLPAQPPAAFLKCDAETPMINLEAAQPFKGASFQGPFYGIAQDHQDGLGTCYANTAKNLLLGLSGGKAQASFLDLALLYKKIDPTKFERGLDAGHTCVTLREVGQHGFCPQQYAVAESGESNPLGPGLFGSVSDLNAHAFSIGYLSQFLQQNERLNQQHQLDQALLKNSRMIATQLKQNPLIKIPLPVIRHRIPGNYELKELYSGPAEQWESFSQEYAARYSQFVPLQIQAVLQKKGAAEIFELYQQHMQALLEKHGMAKHLPKFRAAFLENSQYDFEDEELQQTLQESLKFLKNATDSSGLSDKEFAELCGEPLQQGLEFIQAFKQLLDHMEARMVNPEVLFDQDQIKAGHELMQLLIAPACINPVHRQVPAFGIKCSDGYEVIKQIKTSGLPLERQLRVFRSKVVSSLLEGLALGNTYPTEGTAAHVNTIVGMRFNPGTGQCEYRIRDSQQAESRWEPEARIFQQIQALTEVRKAE
jgi:hypothetical protein